MHLTRNQVNRRQAFFSLLPIIVILLVLRVYPISVVIMKSFTNWDGLYRNDWVGLNNYISFIKDGPFLLILRNTFILLASVPLQVFLGFLVALLLYEKVIGWRFFRAVIYMPQIISAVVIGYLFKIFFGMRGPFNTLLTAIGLNSMAIEWFGNGYTALLIIVISLVWFGLGWQAIVMLGGLSTISPSVFEAAILDGANYWQRAFKVVIPMLMRTFEFAIIASSVWTLTQLFPFLFSMTRGGPGYETTTFDYMIYKKSFGTSSGSNYGMACAIAVILLFIVLSLTLIERRVTEQSEDWG